MQFYMVNHKYSTVTFTRSDTSENLDNLSKSVDLAQQKVKTKVKRLFRQTKRK